MTYPDGRVASGLWERCVIRFGSPSVYVTGARPKGTGKVSLSGDAAAAYVGEFVDGRIPKPPGNARSKFRRAFSMGVSRTTIDDALTLW